MQDPQFNITKIFKSENHEYIEIIYSFITITGAKNDDLKH